jgi:hypothetical protein
MPPARQVDSCGSVSSAVFDKDPRQIIGESAHYGSCGVGATRYETLGCRQRKLLAGIRAKPGPRASSSCAG